MKKLFHICRILGLSAVMLLAACSTTDVPELSEDPALEPQATVQTVRNLHTQKCIDTPQPWRAGQTVVQHSCHNGSNQRFELVPVYAANIVKIRNNRSGLCLSAKGYRGYGTARMLLEQQSCHNNYLANFSLTNTVTVNGSSSKVTTLRWLYDANYCLDVPGGWTSNGLRLQLYPCHGGANQRWITANAPFKQAKAVFFEGNNATQDVVCTLTIPASGRQIIDFTRHRDCDNDETRSVKLIDVSAGTIIEVYDDSSCSKTRDDYAIIAVLTDHKQLVISTYEQNLVQSNLRITYRHGGNLDGKVSCVRLRS